MSRSPLRDLLAGVFVVAGLAAVAFLAFRVGEAPFSHKGGLALYATFDEVSGLKPLAPSTSPASVWVASRGSH